MIQYDRGRSLMTEHIQRCAMEKPSRKCKAINDFFKPISKRPDSEQVSTPQPGLEGNLKQAFTVQETPVPGLTLLPNFIQPGE